MISPVNGNRAAAVGSAVQKHLLDNAGERHAQVPVLRRRKSEGNRDGHEANDQAVAPVESMAGTDQSTAAWVATAAPRGSARGHQGHPYPGLVLD